MSKHTFSSFFLSVCSHSAKPPLSPSFHSHSLRTAGCAFWRKGWDLPRRAKLPSRNKNKLRVHSTSLNLPTKPGNPASSKLFCLGSAVHRSLCLRRFLTNILPAHMVRYAQGIDVLARAWLFHDRMGRPFSSADVADFGAANQPSPKARLRRSRLSSNGYFLGSCGDGGGGEARSRRKTGVASLCDPIAQP
jgi:hypothetical protein